MPHPHLKIDSLSKEFKDKKALNEVSFSLTKGAIYGLIGHNGAGKTTLLRILTQIFTPDAGEVLFNGELLSAKHVSKIGYLPEERGLYTDMKVGEYLLFLSKLHVIKKKEALEQVKWWLDQLKIADYEKQEINKLSKGNQQKIQFIASVFFNPELLILDEPFSGLDPSNLELIKNEILRLNKQGTTVLFSTHQMEAVEDLCQEISMIHKGEIVLSGSLAEMKQGARKQYFIQTAEQLNEREGLKKHKNGYLISFTSGIEKQEFVSSLDSTKLESFYVHETSLREIFLERVSAS